MPEIFRALKTVVDELRQEQGEKIKGRFLLTGSANIMALPKLSDPLVGRMGVLTLYPVSSAESLGGAGDFIEKTFSRRFPYISQGQALHLIQISKYFDVSGAIMSQIFK